MAVKKPVKATSSEDKLRNPLNSLFFGQGKKFRHETFDFLGWLKDLEAKTDEEKLAALKDASKVYKHPKIGIYTTREDGETHHADASLTPTGGGVYDGEFPDIFPDDGPDPYLICGVEYPLISFITDEHIAWEAFADEHKLSENIARRNQITLDINKTIPSDEDINRMTLELPSLIETRSQLITAKAKLTRDLDTDDEAIAKVTARIVLTTAEMQAIQDAMHAHANKHDFYQLAVDNSPHRKEMQELRDAYRLAYLEYAHRLATQKELTTETFDAWKKTASGSDFDNAEFVVSEGNDLLTLGQAAQPLNRDQRRKNAMNNLKN